MSFKRVRFSNSKQAYKNYRSIAKGYEPYNKGVNVHSLLFRQSKGTWLIRDLGYYEPSFGWALFKIGGHRVA